MPCVDLAAGGRQPATDPVGLQSLRVPAVLKPQKLSPPFSSACITYPSTSAVVVLLLMVARVM